MPPGCCGKVVPESLCRRRPDVLLRRDKSRQVGGNPLCPWLPDVQPCADARTEGTCPAATSLANTSAACACIGSSLGATSGAPAPTAAPADTWPERMLIMSSS